MKRTTIKKSANKLVKVERWIEKYGDEGDYWDGISAVQLPTGLWLCEIEIPVIDVVTRAICKTEANAMLRAADKAEKIIKEFLQNDVNTDKTIEDIRHWEMEIGENGEFISMGLSKKQREREGRQIIAMTIKTSKAIEKAVDQIEKINGSSKNLVIEVVDKSNFPSSMDDKTILDELENRVAKQYGHLFTVSSMIRRNLAIYVGYVLEEKVA